MQLPNPDVEDVHILLNAIPNSIPNLFVVDDLDLVAMLVEVLHVDEAQILVAEITT